MPDWKKIINPWTELGKEEYNCFMCSPTNPKGLHLSFYEDGDDVVTLRKQTGQDGGADLAAADDDDVHIVRSFSGRSMSKCRNTHISIILHPCEYFYLFFQRFGPEGRFCANSV